MGQSDRPGMTLGRKVAYAIAVLVVLLLAAYRFGLFGLFPLTDEPPIRVKNGSIVIELDKGEWVNGGDDSWSPSMGTSSGDFSVRVVDGPGDCRQGRKATGKIVHLSYSVIGSGKFHFTVGRKFPWIFSRHTEVGPKKLLTLSDSKKQLRYPATKDEGYISEIVVEGGGAPWGCTFDQYYEGLEIYICPSTSTNECK